MTTTVKKSTIRDLLNSNALGRESDGIGGAPLGDLLSVLLDVANPGVVVGATTIGAALTPSVGAVITPTVGAALTKTVGAAVVQGSGPTAQANATTPAGVGYVQADQTALADLANALKVLANLIVTDVTNLTTRVNQAIVDIGAVETLINAERTDLAATVVVANAVRADDNTSAARVNEARVDILMLRAALAAAQVGTVGGATETGIVPVSNIATLAANASCIISVRATAAGTTGVKKLVRDPAHILITGDVYWDGKNHLTFAAVDAVTACDVIYATASGSQKVSCLMSDAI